jgi:DNA helicase-4
MDEIKHRELFRSFQSYALTSEQTSAAVSRAKETVVIASAGSGKTSLLLGRAKYLLDSKRAQPGEILTLAFNRAASQELQERADALHMPLACQTFHSYGLSLLNSISRTGGVAFADEKSTEQFLKNCFEKLSTSNRASVLCQYFSDLLVPFRGHDTFKDISEYAAYVRGSVPITLSNDYVKSHGEWLIANFLFSRGYEFRYEELFSPKGRSDLRHKPDFTVHGADGQCIYIEYFGIDGTGKTAPWVNNEAYLEGIEWKRKAHLECGTWLAEVTYQDLLNGDLLDKLEQQLRFRGFHAEARSTIEVLQRANQVGYSNRFLTLSATFLKHCRAKRFSSAKLLEMSYRNQRTRAFVEIFVEMLKQYEEELTRLGKPDFSDLIHKAADQLEMRSLPFPFTHVLVDEYQDISEDRQRLIEAMRIANPSLEITLVGDDWQAINRFAGSDLSILRRASKPRFNRKFVALTKTHRFQQSLADASSAFIVKNPLQIEKAISSSEENDSHQTLFIHWDTEVSQHLSNLSTVIDFIGEGNSPGNSLMVLSRYSNNLPSQKAIEQRWRGPVVRKTIHSAKGMESDYVVVMDLQQDNRGFPSTIDDDPILSLVLPEEESYPYAEERRLFYVALTRARVACHLISPSNQPSLFAKELLGDQIGTHVGLDRYVNAECPICKSGRTIRNSNGGSDCSNRPICRHITPKCSQCDRHTELISLQPRIYKCTTHPNSKFKPCPKCDIGVLVERKGPHSSFLACHTYSITGCSGSMKV